MSSHNEVPEDVVIVHLDDSIGSKILTNFYRTTVSKFKINSTIIINDNIALSNEIIHHTKHRKSIPPQLLYRATRDGFTPINFHSKCHNQGPTLTIIKSAEPYNQIFGGFTSQSWQAGDRWISDVSAFLFKIEHVESGGAGAGRNYSIFRKFDMKPNQHRYAIYSGETYFPTFGYGHDLCIETGCHLNEHCSSANFGYTYQLPPKQFKYKSDEAKSYLAGSIKFKVSEIEVFKIVQQ